MDQTSQQSRATKPTEKASKATEPARKAVNKPAQKAMGKGNVRAGTSTNGETPQGVGLGAARKSISMAAMVAKQSRKQPGGQSGETYEDEHELYGERRLAE